MILFKVKYKEFGISENKYLRLNFAYNFPCIVSLEPKLFEKFRNIYINMISNDTSQKVRYTLVSSIHEIIDILGKIYIFMTIYI